jgi:SynChlorMet cassette radical SAM/SPASM protein ScmE
MTGTTQPRPAGAPPRVMRTPREVDLEITARCNLRCPYCYYFGNEAVSYRDLPAAEWLRFFAELEACGVMAVTLQGGEPFMRKDLRELVDGIVAHRMRFSVLTNGTLIGEETADWLAASGRCDVVQFSVDGGSAPVHDATRGPGSFERMVQGLERVRGRGVRVGARVTINRHNVRHLEETAAFLLGTLGLPSFGTNSAGYLGQCRVHADSVMLSAEEQVLAMRTLDRLSRTWGDRIQATAGPLADIRNWRRMEAGRRDGTADPTGGGGRLTGCGCIFSKLAVRADGAFVPCCMLAHIELGRINRDPLRAVWQDHPALQDLRARVRIPLSAFEQCRGCPYQPHCTGNCAGLAYTLTGQVNHPSPEGCLRAFLAAGGTLDALREDTA